MATYKGANRTIMDAITPSTVLDAGLAGGVVRCMVDTYTGLGTESASDTIEMGGDLPLGARVLDVIISCDTIGGSPDVGDAESSERYVSEATDNAITRMDMVAGAGYEITDKPGVSPYDSQILVLLDAAVTALGTITVIVFYTVE